MQNSLSAYKTVTSAQYHPTQEIDIPQSNAINGLLVILVPVVVVCAIVGYRKYRAVVLQQQIQLLNQLWQLDSNRTIS